MTSTVRGAPHSIPLPTTSGLMMTFNIGAIFLAFTYFIVQLIILASQFNLILDL